MPVPSYRVPVRVARGTKAALDSGLASLEEGEVCYATDENALYVVEGGVLTAAGSDVSAASIGDLSDVDTTTSAPTDGQVLIWNNVDGEWQPGNSISDVVSDTTPQLGGNLDVNGNQIVSTSGGDIEIAPDTTGGLVVRGNSTDGKIKLNCTANTHGVTIQSPPHADAATYSLILPSGAGTAGQVLTSQGGAQLTWEDAGSGGGATSIDDLTDVDTSTTPPTNGQVLEWNGTNWIPADAATEATPSVIGWTIDSDSIAATSKVLTAPTHVTGNLLVACIMRRASGGTLTAPSGWSLHGEYLSNIVTLGDAQTISVFTKIATASEPTTYTWTQQNSSRICGWIASVEGASSISSVTESYGNSQTASIPTLSGYLNLTAATWIYSATTGDETYSQSGPGVTEITDSPKEQARISGGYTTSTGIVTSTHSGDNVAENPNHGIINIRLTTPSSIDQLDDVDTSTTPPTTGQVLEWDGTNWVPADAATGGGGGSTGSRLSEGQTASSGAATFTGLGHSGTFVSVTSSLDAWIVFYGSVADRTSDAGRSYSTDPTAGSGVLAEFYITAGSTVLATPGTTYFNNDTSVTEALYVAVRDQAGVSVDSLVTVVAYGDQTITSISGGTFGSGI